MMNLVKALVLAVSVCGCAHSNIEVISPDQFRNYGDTPLSHTVYLGSDSTYHYFAWSNGKSDGEWKMEKVSMRIGKEFAKGEREAFLVHGPDGDWCAYPCR